MIPATSSRFLLSSHLRSQLKVAAATRPTAPRLSYDCNNRTAAATGRRHIATSCTSAVKYGRPGAEACSKGLLRGRVGLIPLATATPTAASGGSAVGAVLGAGPGSRRVAGVASAAASVSSMASPAAAGADTAAAAAVQLWSEIVQVYDKAQASGACSKTETQVELFHDATLGVDFVLRVASALKAKPQGPPQPPQPTTADTATATAAPAAAWRNPFLPPEPDLFVRQLGPEHNLVLNKFNVVVHHVLVTSREFRSQAEPLYGSDLAATLEVLRAMPDGGVAFYNCGPLSGRSQPHKHLQVVPLPFMEGQPPLAPVHSLVEGAAAAAAASAQGGADGATAPTLTPLTVRKAPYRCYVSLLPDSPTPQQLESAFNELLQLCHPGYTYVPPLLQLDGPPRDAATAAAAATRSVSYNVVMTRSWLMLVPRSAERCGPLAPNSLAFAGTMLVRSEDELQYVRQTGPAAILASIGEPW